MVTKNIKAYAKKYLPIIGIALLIFASVISYSVSRPTASTFINHQSKAVLADDIFNTCKTSCPTEKQTPFAAHIQGQHVLPTPYGLAPPSLILVFLILVACIFKAFLQRESQTFFAAASKQSLYSMWRI